MVGAILLAVGGAAHVRDGRKVEAEEFVVRDRDGNTRLWLGTAPDDGSPMIYFHDSKGVPRMQIQLTDNGNPFLAFTDAQVNHRLVMSQNPDGSSDLSFYNKENLAEPRFHLGMSANAGTPFVEFRHNAQANRRLVLDQNKDGTSGVFVLDKDGQVISQIPGP